MRAFFSTVIALFILTAFSQTQRIDYEKVNQKVKATYYYQDNATIEKVGFFNAKGDLDGTWTSYDMEGKITIIANYKKGKKDGVWEYYKPTVVNIVTYKNNKIINIRKEKVEL